MNLGTFEKLDDDAFTGTVNTLMFQARVRIAPNDRKKADSQPDYRVYAGNAEIGAGWTKTSQQTGRPYISVKLDDPSFAAPIFAALVQTEEGGHQLIWSGRPGGNRSRAS